MPKNKNMAKERRIICWVGWSVSRKAEPKPASNLVLVDNDLLLSSFAADGESSAAAAGVFDVSPLMRGCLIVVSSSSSWNEDEPSSMSRSCSIRGDIFLHMVIANLCQARQCKLEGVESD